MSWAAPLIGPTPEDIFEAVRAVNAKAHGAYAVVALIIGAGLVAFRDPNGVRPLVFGSRKDENGKTEYMVASESVALDTLGFTLIRDVAPGEAIYITEDGEFHSAVCAETTALKPCIFEYVYFARPDSVMNGVSVYAARVRMGRYLGEKIKRSGRISTLTWSFLFPRPPATSRSRSRSTSAFSTARAL